MKNIAKILCFVLALAAVFTIVGVTAFAEESTVTTAAELKNAVEAGGEVKLGGDITTDVAIVTSGVTTVIDLNGNTLTIGAGDNKFNDESNITFKNGTIDITGVTVNGNAIFCLDEYEETLVSYLTLENVNLVGDGYSSAYGIFYIGKSSELNVNGGEWNLANDTFSAGGVFKADASSAVLNISNLTLNAHNVRRLVTYAATVIENSTIAISGDADGVDAEMEHGFNRSPLAITNSTVTMENIVGRGITAQNGEVKIEGSIVTIKNAKEASIDIRNGQTITVDDSTVALTKAPTITSGSFAIEGEGKVEYGTLAAVHVSGNRYWGECGGSADESFEFYFYYDDTCMGVASLKNIDGVIDGDVYVTWSMYLGGNPSTTSSWSNDWYINPSIDMQPNRVVQVVDGVEVAEKSITPDCFNKVVALTADADGNLTGFHATLSSALTAGDKMVVVLRDVTESIDAIENVNIVSGVDTGVTITNTATGIVDFDYVTLGEGVTLNVGSLYSGDSENTINGTLNVTGIYEHSYNAYTYVSGKVTVGALVITSNDMYEGSFTVSGDYDNPTEVKLVVTTLTIDSGAFNAYNAVIECGSFTASGTATFDVYNSAIYADSYSIDADLDYKAQVNDDGSFTIVEKYYVARVTDGKNYETLQEAIDAANGKVIIVLDKNALNETITIPDGYKFVVGSDEYGNTVCGVVLITATPEIIGGYWYIGGVNTGYIAAPEVTIVDGFWCINGQITDVRAETINGHDPEVTIDPDDGYWYIDGVKTEVRAKAEDGIGIREIVKQENDGSNVDVYVIYFTDGTSTIFTVTNGLDGGQGAPGLQGPEGLPGDKGDQGAAGEDGYSGDDVVIISIVAAAVCAVLALSVLGYRIFKRDPFALRF